jgi:serine/threonine protein kinase
VKYYEIYEDSKALYIVMEDCQGRTIYDKITSDDSFSEQQCCKIAEQLLRALNHCHSNGVTHRDIKIENIIVNDYGDSKLIDFGLSKGATSKQILRSMAGTPYYMAPEILQGKAIHSI